MIGYILQTVAFQLLFLLVYELLLKKETFFSYNRWYLLLTFFISLLLPLFRIEGLALLVPEESIAVMTNVWLPDIFIGGDSPKIQELPAVNLTEEKFRINWWIVLYVAGLAGSLLLFLRKYSNLSRLFRFRSISSERDVTIIEVPNSEIACTFYKTIFLGDKLSEAEKKYILPHELVHVKQKHSLDLMFFELLKILFWFNPLVYIYQSRIAVIHEFIADANVIKTTEKISYYEQLLNSVFNTSNISFTNQFFNHSLTRLTAFGRTINFGNSGGQVKKRIVMLQKSKSKTIAKVKYLVILPLMLVMLTIVSCSQEDSGQPYNNQSLSDQLDQLKLKIIEADQISEEDNKKIIEITMAAIEKSKKGSAGNDITKRREYQYSNGDNVPFAVIDQVPVFPGCEDLGSNEAQKKCMSDKITDYVNKNFNTGLGKELKLSGTNRIIVQFKIDKNGNIADARARAPHPALEEEALRVINGIPQMKPGKQDGEEVGVMYSLPIVFQVSE